MANADLFCKDYDEDIPVIDKITLSTNSIDELKYNSQQESKDETNQFVIFIQQKDDHVEDTFALTIPSQTTSIKDIKRMISEEKSPSISSFSGFKQLITQQSISYSPKSQLLVYKDEILHDDEPISSYDIKASSIIQLFVYHTRQITITISLTVDGTTHISDKRVSVHYTSPVSNLVKNLLASNPNIPRSRHGQYSRRLKPRSSFITAMFSKTEQYEETDYRYYHDNMALDPFESFVFHGIKDLDTIDIESGSSERDRVLKAHFGNNIVFVGKAMYNVLRFPFMVIGSLFDSASNSMEVDAFDETELVEIETWNGRIYSIEHAEFKNIEHVEYDELLTLISHKIKVSNLQELLLSVNGLCVDSNNVYSELWFDGNATIFVENCNHNISKSIQVPNCLILIISADNEIFQVHINLHWNIKRVKDEFVRSMIESKRLPTPLVIMKYSNCHLLYNGTYLYDDQTVKEMGITASSKMDLVTNDNGGNSLKYISWLSTFENEHTSSGNVLSSFLNLVSSNVKHNKASKPSYTPLQLNKLRTMIETRVDNKRRVELAFNKAKYIVSIAKTNNKDMECMDDSLLYIVYLWTTNLIYKQLNKALEANTLLDLNEWKLYLYYLHIGLSHLPYYFNRTVYRGISGVSDLSGYEKNAVVSFRRVTATTKSKEMALFFAQRRSPSVLFEIVSMDGRDIASLSTFKGEEEVLFLPHSHFKILDIKLIKQRRSKSTPANSGNDEDETKQNIELNQEMMKKCGEECNVILISMQQICVPRSNQIILWVDDEPQNNIKYIHQYVERKQICPMICRSTKEAMEMLNSYQWISKLNHAKLRIVTDMVRKEGDKMIYNAGIGLITLLRSKYKLNHHILIFCGNVKKARQQCLEHNITHNVYVTLSTKVLKSFISFQNDFLNSADQQYQLQL
eukprot:279944_1